MHAAPYLQGVALKVAGLGARSHGWINTQPGRVQAAPNLHGFEPAPGMTEVSTKYGDGVFTGGIDAGVGAGTTVGADIPGADTAALEDCGVCPF